uniref:Uncharacterized protein n=1 Tax=Mycena chlorophos TaxID=658473 RepID=A0ABQ0L3H4_MYCCL|nr:predicted protein [Mycena chlorophos]
MAAFRASLRTLARPLQLSSKLALPARQLHATRVALKKVAADEFDDPFAEEPVDDLFAAAPEPEVEEAPVKPSKHRSDGRLTERERRTRLDTLFAFVEPRVGRTPAEKMPLLRKSVFPQLLHLTMTPEDLHKVSTLMISWKEGNMGTQGKARYDAHGRVRGANPFQSSTSELFSRRACELGIPEHALAVFGDLPKYALPMTLPAARRLLRGLVDANRPFTEVVTTVVLFERHGLSPAQNDFASCALVLGAALKHLEAHPGDANTKLLVEQLVPALEKGLATAEPMPGSPDPREKSLREWLKDAMKNLNAFLEVEEKPRAWLEDWMKRSRFFPSTN